MDSKMEEVINRKLKKPRKSRPETEEVRRPATSQWGMKNYLPSRDLSEEDVSIATHQKWLVAEKRKRQPDFKMVQCCMDKTLADRRKCIVSEKPPLSEIKAQYPWLFDEDQVQYVLPSPLHRECSLLFLLPS